MCHSCLHKVICVYAYSNFLLHTYFPCIYFADGEFADKLCQQPEHALLSTLLNLESIDNMKLSVPRLRLHEPLQSEQISLVNSAQKVVATSSSVGAKSLRTLFLSNCLK